MKKAALITLALVIFFCGRSFASLKEDVKKGNLLYNNGKYSEAAKSYESALSSRPGYGIANFNHGAALYKGNSYYGAIESFNKAIAGESGRSAIISAADYNIGNATYRIGNSKEVNDLERAKELYETALKFYKRSIDLDPSDKDAKFNYEFVANRLKALRQSAQQQQEKKEEKKDQKKDKQKDQQKNQDKQDQSNGGGGGKSQEDKGKEGSGENKEENKGEGENKEKGEEERQKEPGQQQEGEGSEEQQGKNEEGQKGEDKGREGKEEEKKEGAGLAAYQAPQSKEEAGEMTEQEAKMLLDGYKGEEATGRAIRMRNKPIDMPEPAKDW